MTTLLVAGEFPFWWILIEIISTKKREVFIENSNFNYSWSIHRSTIRLDKCRTSGIESSWIPRFYRQSTWKGRNPLNSSPPLETVGCKECVKHSLGNPCGCFFSSQMLSRKFLSLCRTRAHTHVEEILEFSSESHKGVCPAGFKSKFQTASHSAFSNVARKLDSGTCTQKQQKNLKHLCGAFKTVCVRIKKKYIVEIAGLVAGVLSSGPSTYGLFPYNRSPLINEQEWTFSVPRSCNILSKNCDSKFFDKFHDRT